MRHVARRQHEDRQQPAGRIAAAGRTARRDQAERPADQRDEQRFGEHERQDRAVARSPASSAPPSSLVRSRTDCAIVLAATSRIMNSTTDRIAIMIAPMSPT